MALAERAAELMPGGVPSFKEVRSYPSIAQLVKQTSYKDMHKAIQVLIQNFCDSFNVVRNMTANQVFEAATYLLDESHGFRLEDYVMMFTMAKRGQFVKIRDRVDISVIAEVLDGYWHERDQAGKRLQEQEVKDVDNLLNSQNVVFTPEIEQVFTDWRKSMQEELKKEEKPVDKTAVKAYAALHGINISELEKNFPIDTPKKD